MTSSTTARRAGITAGALAVLLLVAGVASAKPRVVTQRAVASDPFTVMTHQAGGVVVASWSPPMVTTAAYRPSGKPLWRRVRDQGCGLCHGDIRPLRQPDGSFGPLGFTGITTWAYTRSGADAPVCVGLMLADGSCVTGEAEPDPAAPGEYREVIVRRSGAHVVWSTPVPGVLQGRGTWNVPSRVVRDRDGIAYLTTGGLKDAATGAEINDRIYAVRVADGTIQGWHDTGEMTDTDYIPVEPLVGLGSGAAVSVGAAGLRVANPDGSVRWARAGSNDGHPRDAIFDVKRRRLVYTAGRGPQVVAVRPTDGRVLWRTPVGAGARLLTIAPNGVVYVASTAGRQRGVWALNLRGMRMWRLAVTGVPKSGAMTTRGRLAVTTRDQRGNGRLLYIAPR